MSKTSTLRWPLGLVSLLIAGVGLWGILAARPAEAQTFTGFQGYRTRILLGFQVDPQTVQSWLPAPWQLNPLAAGPLKGANFTVGLFDFVREEDAEGKPKYSGANLLCHVGGAEQARPDRADGRRGP